MFGWVDLFAFWMGLWVWVLGLGLCYFFEWVGWGVVGLSCSDYRVLFGWFGLSVFVWAVG